MVVGVAEVAVATMVMQAEPSSHLGAQLMPGPVFIGGTFSKIAGSLSACRKERISASRIP